ncbi:MAG TPA: SDR family oxidoreductase [Novosphingobium sp.]|nr:SDR family oxidoreductase [Novosphingobium sp.]
MGMLEGKAVLVTGAGRGVGRGIALAMAREGAAVVVNDLGVALSGEGQDGASPAEQVVEEIRAMGGRAVANHASVADWDGACSMIKAAVDSFGRIDGVVNNAGNLRDVLFHKMGPDDFRAVIEVHLFGSFNTSRAAAPFFKEQGSGAFVHMTSSSGLVRNLGQANYMAAKMGIVGLSKSIAIDMARFGVRSNAVAPWAWTRMVSSIPAETPEQQKRVEGLKKLDADRIGPFCAALCSDQAAHVTGQIFGVRNNEIYLFSQNRPIRTAHTAEGWTPQSICERVFPQFENDFYPLHKSGDLFTWEPV